MARDGMVRQGSLVKCRGGRELVGSRHKEEDAVEEAEVREQGGEKQAASGWRPRSCCMGKAAVAGTESLSLLCHGASP